MKKKETALLIIAFICLVGIVGILIYLNINYFKELSYKEVMQKINNKESFVLVITQTTCSHCESFKPKVKQVANDYRINIYYMEADLLDEVQRNAFLKIVHYDGTPTTVFFINGEEETAASRINGDASTDKIIKKLKSNGFID